MKTLLIYTFSLLLLSISGCNKDKIPGVYRIDVRQGNDVTQEMLNQLEPGMTKSQVAYVMGTPLLIDTFNPNRWDYIYTYQPGNGDREQRRITVFFKDEKLNRLDGNTRVVAREELPEIVRTDKNVVVPLTKRNTGLIDDIKDTLGMTDETEAIVEEEIELPEPAEVPVPKQNTGLLDKVKDTLSSDDEPEEIYSEDTDEESEGPGLIERIKSGIGLGDEEVE
jgi:outer membrane protein assembly factor BamE